MYGEIKGAKYSAIKVKGFFAHVYYKLETDTPDMYLRVIAFKSNGKYKVVDIHAIYAKGRLSGIWIK